MPLTPEQFKQKISGQSLPVSGSPTIASSGGISQEEFKAKFKSGELGSSQKEQNTTKFLPALKNIGTNLKDRKASIDESRQMFDRGEQSLGSGLFQAAGQGAGMASDVLGGTLSAITPEFIEKPITKAIGGVIKPIAQPIEKGLQKIGETKPGLEKSLRSGGELVLAGAEVFAPQIGSAASRAARPAIQSVKGATTQLMKPVLSSSYAQNIAKQASNIAQKPMMSVGTRIEAYYPDFLESTMPELSTRVRQAARQDASKSINKVFGNTIPSSKKLKLLEKRGINLGDKITRYGLLPDVDFDSGDVNWLNVAEEIGDSIVPMIAEPLDNHIQQYKNVLTDRDRFFKDIEQSLKKPEYVKAGESNDLLRIFEKWKQENSFKNNFSTVDINDFRRIANNRAKSAYKADGTVNKNFFTELGDVSRKYVDSMTNDDFVRSVNKEIGDLLEIKKVLTSKGGSKLVAGRAGKMAAEILGALILVPTLGAAMGGVGYLVGGILGKIGGDMFIKLLRKRAFGKNTELIVRRLADQPEILDAINNSTKNRVNRVFLQKMTEQAALALPEPSGQPTGNFSPIRMGGETVNNFEPQSQQVFTQTERQLPKPLGLPAPKSNAQGPTIRLPQQTQTRMDMNTAQNALPRSNFAAEQRMANTFGLPAPRGAAQGVPMEIPQRGAVPRGIGDEASVPRMRQRKATVNASESLIQEARKYDNVQDFINAQSQKSYRSTHQIDTRMSSPVIEIKDDILNTFIEEFKRQYGYPSLKSKEINKLKSIISNPEADVKIYRASPKNELNSGDWVTIDKDYANDIKRQNGGKVYSYTVKAKDLFYPKTLDGFKELPSLNKWGAFQYQDTQTKSQLADIWEKANKKPRLRRN